MKWTPLSKKQLQLMTWWMPNSPYKNCEGIIAEGSIRSGKTLVMSSSYIFWATTTSNDEQFIIGGKTIGSLRRNVIKPLKQVLLSRGYKITDNKTENVLIISNNKNTNTFFLFGGRDESSQDLVQGLTAKGAFLDEVALMPKSFVEQVTARCSVEGRKYWFNCNPDGPQHYFYTDYVQKAKERNFLKLHFNLEDNPSLSQHIIDYYKSMYTGIFYKRFILGEWAFADGVIYDCFSLEKNTYKEEDKQRGAVPIQILENDPNGGYPYIASDYGVLNPMVYLEMYKIYLPGDPVPHYYVEDEYYYDGRKSMKQKSDEEYANDLEKFIGSKYYKSLIIDPSASSMIAAVNRRGIRATKAKNNVQEGIHLVYTLMSTGHIHINRTKCPNLVNELGLYIWNAKRGETGKEDPVKQNDHACDALRYGIATTTYKGEVVKGIEN